MSLCGQCPKGTAWCGECYEVKRGRSTPQLQAQRNKFKPSPAQVDPPPRRASIPEAATVARVAVSRSEDWRHLYPSLWSHLTQGRDSEGGHRQTSTLLLFLEGGMLKLCLHDRAMDRVCFLSVGGLPEGLAQLEDSLTRGTATWRRKKKFR